MVEYRYTCSECYDETFADEPNLKTCPYCHHPLNAPIEITEDPVGILAGRLPTSKGLRQKLD